MLYLDRSCLCSSKEEIVSVLVRRLDDLTLTDYEQVSIVKKMFEYIEYDIEDSVLVEMIKTAIISKNNLLVSIYFEKVKDDKKYIVELILLSITTDNRELFLYFYNKYKDNNTVLINVGIRQEALYSSLSATFDDAFELVVKYNDFLEYDFNYVCSDIAINCKKSKFLILYKESEVRNLGDLACLLPMACLMCVESSDGYGDIQKHISMVDGILKKYTPIDEQEVIKALRYLDLIDYPIKSFRESKYFSEFCFKNEFKTSDLLSYRDYK